MSIAVADAVAIVEGLSPSDRQRFLRQLRERGILGRRPRGERKAQRNARIRAGHARGLTPGQIARREGMSRDAVKQVLRRAKNGYVKEAYPLKTAAIS